MSLISKNNIKKDTKIYKKKSYQYQHYGIDKISEYK